MSKLKKKKMVRRKIGKSNPRTLPRKVVDVWFCSYRMDVIVTDGADGAFCYPFNPKRPFAVLKVGLDDAWWRVRACLWHELFEYGSDYYGCSYKNDFSRSLSSDGRVFILTHNKMNDVLLEMSDCWGDLEAAVRKAWKTFQTEMRRKRK